MSQEVFNVCHTRAGGTAAVGTVVWPIMFAPTDALGGGITILSVKYYSQNAVAAASAAQPTLITIGTNSAVNGTIASALSSAAWTAGTIRAGTVSTAFVDATYGVAVRWAQTSENAAYDCYVTCIQYTMGY